MQNQDISTEFDSDYQLETDRFNYWPIMEAVMNQRKNLQNEFVEEILKIGDTPKDILTIIQCVSSLCWKFFLAMDIFRKKFGCNHQDVLTSKSQFVWRYSTMDFSGRFLKMQEAAFRLIQHYKFTTEESNQFIRQTFNNFIFITFKEVEFTDILKLMEKASQDKNLVFEDHIHQSNSGFKQQSYSKRNYSLDSQFDRKSMSFNFSPTTREKGNTSQSNNLANLISKQHKNSTIFRQNPRKNCISYSEYKKRKEQQNFNQNISAIKKIKEELSSEIQNYLQRRSQMKTQSKREISIKNEHKAQIAMNHEQAKEFEQCICQIKQIKNNFELNQWKLNLIKQEIMQTPSNANFFQKRSSRKLKKSMVI